MNRCTFALALSGSLLLGLAGVVNADDAQLKAEVQALRNEVAQLKAQQDGGQIDQRRAEEIKALVQDVLADADTRASLMADGAVAGHNGKSFFLSSVDGSNVLNVWGQVQFRWIINLNNSNENDEEDDGFQVPRIKLGFTGHVTAGRKWDYEIIISRNIRIDNDEVGNVNVEDVKVGTQITDAIRVDAGKFKLPFHREELTSSKRTLAVERSIVNEALSVRRAEQVQVSYKSDMIKIAVALSDGAGSEFTDIGSDGVEIALTGRVDVRITGDWGQAMDFSAWKGEAMAIFLGAAVHWETGDSPNGGFVDIHAFTIDGSIEVSGWGIFVAATWNQINPDSGDAVNTYGFVGQVGYNINNVWDPFGRVEFLCQEGTDDDHANALFLTLGVNYYIKGHDAKLTLDVVWFHNNDDSFESPGLNTGSSLDTGTGSILGFSSGDDHENSNFVVRVQFQLLF